MAVSNLGCKDSKVNVFDCMTSTPTWGMVQQVASILATCKPAISLHNVDVQKQNGSEDCGLFAIPFALTLASGNSPGKYVFHQDLMRKHLLKCLTQQIISPFPTK